ncbi:MAG TPA: hypothetical protein VFP84_07620 [Kofleriaceae bacterium]|nr:hypothetical protein [Kofleriaceae bacterium]
MKQPLSASEARQLARSILVNGAVTFTSHCLRELAKDQKTTVDAINVIRGGAYLEAEWENGGWRHRAQTQRMAVVIEIETESELIVVTSFVFR